MSSNVTINENLVKIDNLFTALNYLFEEVQTRKDAIITQDDIYAKVCRRMNEDSYKNELTHYIRTLYGRGLYQEIAFMVMEKIDKDIEAFINDRVDERLKELGVIPSDS